VKEDFILYDNRKRMVVTEFEIHTLGELGMEVRSASQVSSLSEATKGMNRRFFIYLDIQGSDAMGMDNAKASSLHFLDTQLMPSDEVGIIGFSPTRGFFIQQYLTRDHNKIRAALKKAKDIEVKPSAGFLSGGLDDSVPAEARLSAKERTSGFTGNPEDTSVDRRVVTSLSPAIPVPGSSVNHRGDFVPQMSDLAEALKYVPGNKSLLFFSGRNLGPIYKKLGREFATASTPVYTVNTKNWIRQGVISLSVKKKHIWENHSLMELALTSGGKYFPDIKDIESISREVQALTGNYYVLGYYVPDTWDGKYHEIKIDINIPGLKVLAQDGYFNPKPYSKFTELEKQLHLFDLVFSDNPTRLDPMELHLDPLLIADSEEVNFALLARLEVDERTGVPPSKTEIFVFLFNEEEEVVLKRRGEMNLAPYDQQDLFPYITASLPPGEYECRFAARNMDSGQAALGRIPVRVPEKIENGLFLSSPILFASGPESHIVKLNSKGKDKDVSLNDFYRFIPKQHGIIVNEIGADIERVLAVLPMTILAGPDAEVDLNVLLHPRGAGDTMFLPVLYVEAQKVSETKDILMIEISLINVQSGEYDLEIEASNVATKARSSVWKSIMKK
jgi:VWFA-related protein